MAKLVTPDGVTIDWVSRGSGPAIVFVHGWLASQRVWDCQLHALQDRYRCVAFDLRGMGQSEKPDCDYAFTEFAADLSALLRHLDLRDVTLVGWSMGVSVSLAYLERWQSEGRVARTVLVNGPIRLINAGDWALGIPEDECMGYIDGLVERPIDGRREFAAANLHEPSDAEVDFMFGLSLQTPLDVAMKAVRQQMTLDQRGVLTTLDMPVLAVSCEHDFYPVALGEYIAATAPRGRLTVMNGCGHTPQLQNPARFDALLEDFVAST